MVLNRWRHCPRFASLVQPILPNSSGSVIAALILGLGSPRNFPLHRTLPFVTLLPCFHILLSKRNLHDEPAHSYDRRHQLGLRANAKKRQELGAAVWHDA